MRRRREVGLRRVATLLLALSPLFQECMRMADFMKIIICTPPFMLLRVVTGLIETAGGVTQGQWIWEPGICLLGNK